MLFILKEKMGLWIEVFIGKIDALSLIQDPT